MSTATTYRYLFQPLRVGPVVVRNRVVFSAHLTNYAADGHPSAQHAAYYAARAAGGVGLIITEEHSTHPTDWPYEKLIHGFQPSVVPGYRRITEAVHHYDVPVFAQINHNGGQGSGMYSRLPVWAPSPVADPLFREVPKAVTLAEIAEIVGGYATVAEHCREGGFDGVELQCSHSSIVRQFLSPATNVRTDRYGGSLENRSRLLLELVAAVREAIGPELALGVRLCGDELIEGGTTIQETVEVARAMERTGQVDYVNTSIGVATATLYMIEASMQVPPGYALWISSAIRKAVSLPVIGVGRFKDPLQADRALAEGHADLIGVVRGQIADADFAAKARAGRASWIRNCLSCNQECVGRMGLNRWLGCIENPRTGREAEAAAVTDAPPSRDRAPEDASAAGAGPGDHGGLTVARSAAQSAVRLAAQSAAQSAVRLAVRRDRPVAPAGAAWPGRRRVLVVGAGPGGMQAAIAAARRGHAVEVYEAEADPGGQIRVAATVPSRAELADLVRNQRSEADRFGVTVHYGTRLDTAAALAERPDAMVVATGAVPERPWWAGDAARVVDVRDVLEGRVEPHGEVLVVDELGFHQATSVAELLADRGCRVEVMTPGMVVGQDLGITLDMETWCMKASAKGITQTTNTMVTAVSAVTTDEPGTAVSAVTTDEPGTAVSAVTTDGAAPTMTVDGDGARRGLTVTVQQHTTGSEDIRRVDWVVCAVPPRPADELWRELRRRAGRQLPIERVGDCVAPRRAHAAVIEGERAGASL